MKETETAVLSESQENYVEAIFRLMENREAVRPKDISGAFGISAAAVTAALKSLAEKGLVNYAPHDFVTLTPEGRARAKEVLGRHRLLRRFLIAVLGTPPQEAEEVACRMEHVVTPAVFERFTQFLHFVETQKAGKGAVIEQFKQFLNSGEAAGAQDALELSSSLADLRLGKRARIEEIGCAKAVARRLWQLGLTQGAVVTLERVAPFGDPITVRVRGGLVSLTKAQAQKIRIQRID
jgi:DtxR family Mn-dependent transcriptional regulator